MNDREMIINIAKMFKGNEEVNWETTSIRSLLLLIKESVEYTLKEVKE